MTTRAGAPTSGRYGLSALLVKLFRDERPAGGAWALDEAGPTFRHAAYDAYKGTRLVAAEARAPLVAELAGLPELIAATGLPAFGAAGFEADDVLATLARQVPEPTIVSGDRDVLQLARGACRVLYVARGVEAARLDEAAVKARFGVPPARLPDYVALVGDPSDNLPGVPGVGARTAARLVGRFGGVRELLARLDEVEPPRLRERLRAHADRLPLWLELARLRDDVPLPPGPRWAPLDVDALGRLFVALEFESLLPRLEALRR
jgi:DNA polymerase-1